MATAEIITIGSELLLGETADTNTRFIARVLRGLGIDLFRTQTVGDNTGRIVEAVRLALQRADIVITTGGLGPTVDDPTRQAMAQVADKELEFRPELWEQISARITRYGRIPTENQKRQAFVPRGAVVIENQVGTAPAFIIETVHGALISLPGVPAEMETLMAGTVLPYLQKRFNLHAVIKVRTLHVGGLGEGVIDDMVGDLETLSNPTVGLTAHSGVVDVRIAAKAGDEYEADQMILKVEKDLRDRLKDNIYGADGDTLEGMTLQAVRERGWSMSCFEFQTEEALRSRLSKTGDPTFRGGKLLLTLPENLVATARDVRKEFAAMAVLGLIYESDGERHRIQAVWVTPQGQVERQFTYGGHPNNSRRWAVNMALDGFRRSLQENQ